MVKILIVEDDEGTRCLMEDVLADSGYETISAANGEEALELLDHHHIDLILMDVMMPRMDGYTLTRQLRESNFTLPILMVTAKITQPDKKKGFLVGVDDYMTKPVDEEEMLLRIAALLRRSKIAAERKLCVGNTELIYDSRTIIQDGREMRLPQKEFLLLYKLLAYPGKTFTRRQLMDEIWDLDTDSEAHTVNVHINRLRERFRDTPDFEIVTVRGLGYKAVHLC